MFDSFANTNVKFISSNFSCEDDSNGMRESEYEIML